MALVLLKAGAEPDKRDVDGNLAIDLAPDDKVGYYPSPPTRPSRGFLHKGAYTGQVREFVRLSAEREGIELQ